MRIEIGIQYRRSCLPAYKKESKKTNGYTAPQILLARLGGASLIRELFHHGSTVTCHTQD
jgi:hypothetical protein